MQRVRKYVNALNVVNPLIHFTGKIHTGKLITTATDVSLSKNKYQVSIYTHAEGTNNFRSGKFCLHGKTHWITHTKTVTE